MARGTWAIYSKDTGSWVSDGTIYRPNEDVPLSTKSTMTSVALVDGDEGYVIPVVKSLKQPINFKWNYMDTAFKTKLETYVDLATPLKIIDHNAVEYVGRFMNVDPQWLSGVVDDDGEDVYNISATFKIMPALA